MVKRAMGTDIVDHSGTLELLLRRGGDCKTGTLELWVHFKTAREADACASTSAA